VSNNGKEAPQAEVQEVAYLTTTWDEHGNMNLTGNATPGQMFQAAAIIQNEAEHLMAQARANTPRAVAAVTLPPDLRSVRR
jgi:hypothetical protein